MSDRPRVLLLADIPGWIVDRCCKAMASRLARQFSITLQYYTALTGKQLALLYPEYDLVHVGNWGDVERLAPVLIQEHDKTLVSVRSHRFPKGCEWIFQRVPLHVVNPDLLQQFPHATYIPDGIDDAILEAGKDFVVGFVGKPDSYKGFQLVKSAVDCVSKQMGYERVKFLPAVGDCIDMPSYYRKIDLLVQPSIAEGFFTVAMEALAMNKRVAITCTGVPKALFVNHANVFWIDRSSHTVEEVIKKCYSSYTVRPFSWESISDRFAVLYWNLIHQTREPATNAIHTS